MPLVRKPSGPSLPTTPAEPGVRDALESNDPDERWAAARAAVGIAGAATRIAKALPGEQDARVREAMFTSMARIGTAASARELLSLLRSGDAALRTGALDALRIMTNAVKDLLPGLLSDPDVDVRILSCELARDLPGDAGSKLLCEVIDRESDVNVCAAAIEVLAEVGTAEAMPVLANCAKRFAGSPFLAFAAATAIDRINAQPASPRG